MNPESENPDIPPQDASTRSEVAPTSETGRSSEEPEATAEAEDTRPVSAADATSTDDADDATPAAEEEQEPEAEADDEEPEDEAEAPEKPKRARRPRRKAAEPEAEKPAQPAPRRRRSQREPGVPAPVVRAQAKYVRSSARKARLVCDHIRGKSVDEARAILALTPRAIAQDWSKLLESAVANAEHNHELVGEDLYVKAVHADEGPTIKRFRPRAMGRATRIRKRTSHLTILLTPKD
jgi:ribosomal protein L22